MKKKPVTFLWLVLAACFFSSCKKQTDNVPGSAITFIRAILHSNSLITVNTLLLSDGNYLIVGKDPANTNPGLMVKMDVKGNIIWQKSVSPLVTVLWKSITLIGSSGFVVAGFDATHTDNEVNVVVYDNDGNILSQKTLLPGKGCTAYSLDMIQLSNGNFAFSGSVLDKNNYPAPFLVITNNVFVQQYVKVYTPLNNEFNYAVSGLCESSGGTINIAGFLTINSGESPFLIRAYPDAVQKSFTYLNDSGGFATPGCIILNNAGSILMPGASARITADSGELVNYKNTALKVVSGLIGINQLSADGNFGSVMQYAGYPNNGLINSIEPTGDGGYILSGTVNQLNAIDFSNTEIFVLKVDANLNKQWSNMYDTDYPSFGVGAFQTPDGGYLISGYHLSYSKNYNMILIKTDGNGNVNQSNN